MYSILLNLYNTSADVGSFNHNRRNQVIYKDIGWGGFWKNGFCNLQDVSMGV